MRKRDVLSATFDLGERYFMEVSKHEQHRMLYSIVKFINDPYIERHVMTTTFTEEEKCDFLACHKYLCNHDPRLVNEEFKYKHEGYSGYTASSAGPGVITFEQ